MFRRNVGYIPSCGTDLVNMRQHRTQSLFERRVAVGSFRFRVCAERLPALFYELSRCCRPVWATTSVLPASPVIRSCQEQ